MPDPEVIPGFIAATFRSVWALELLCLLRKNRDRALPHSEMVGELRASDLVVSQSLASLMAAGLVSVDGDGSARFGPASEALDKMVAEVEDLYANSPDAVRRIIVSAANPSLTAFVDAFRIWKD